MECLDDSVPLLSYNDSESKYTTTEEYEAQVAREVRRYRLKYIFCQSCPKFCHNCRNRFPSEKSVYLVLFLSFFERLAYYAALGNILEPFLSTAYPNISPAVQSLLLSVFLDMSAQLLFPLFGWIADAKIGRYHMLHFSMWFLWCSYGLITLLFSVDDRVSWNRYLLPVWMLIINIGSAAFQATAIPFGADQIVYGPSEQISSFFYWYYWLRNLGAIFLYLSFTCTNFDAHWHGIVFGLIATASMSLVLILNALLGGWFFIDPEKKNPLWNIIKIFLAAVKAKRPLIRSAFSFSNLPAPTRMDLTKTVHGGQFDSEEVENAKTVGRVLTVLLSVSGALIAYRGVSVIVINLAKFLNCYCLQLLLWIYSSMHTRTHTHTIPRTNIIYHTHYMHAHTPHTYLPLHPLDSDCYWDRSTGNTRRSFLQIQHRIPKRLPI